MTPRPTRPRAARSGREIRFVCGQAGLRTGGVPGSQWIIASAYGAEGGIHLIDTKAATSTRLFPSATARERLDKKVYDSCPGPPEGTDRERFRTHGLYLKQGRNSIHTLYVVHHGNRESVEVFELDVTAKPPTIAWIGCAVAPDPIGLNAVVALPEGGFAASNFDPRPPAGARGGGFSPALLEGRNNGELWEWHTGKGWAKVPGSEAAGANGLEISSDGRWYYVAQWGNRTFMRLSRGVTRRLMCRSRFARQRAWAPDGPAGRVIGGQTGDLRQGRRGRGRQASRRCVKVGSDGGIGRSSLSNQ